MKTERRRHRLSLVAWIQLAFAVAAVVLIVYVADMAWGDIPRTADGKPDLSGYYDTATLTPLQRRRQGEEFLSEEQAKQNAQRTAFGLAAGSANQDPDREAPPAGGDGSGGPAGNVGGYDSFWIDPGDDNFQIDGKYPTSIIIDPPNGRLPPVTATAT